MKIANIVGARPQFIKYCPVMRAISRHNSEGSNLIKDILIHTGQHYDYMMSEVFFKDFGIREPDYHLEVGSGSHAQQTGQIMMRVEAILEQEKPDLILVYGDTNSTLAGALAGAKIHIPVGHVEAGLRSFNKYMPEEINRLLTDEISTILFCPSRIAIENLKREGYGHPIKDGELVSLEAGELSLNEIGNINKNNPCIVNIGDIMYDVLCVTLNNLENRPSILQTLGLKEKSYHVMTLHRAENTDVPDKLKEIFEFVYQVSNNFPVLFLVHPRTKKVLTQMQLRLAENIRIIEPLGYFDMVDLLKNSSMILTDSGGLQKEAYWLKIPCITLRDETEWLETVESGWNVLYKGFKGKHQPVPEKETAYGDGRAADRIVNIISTYLGISYDDSK